MALGHLLDDRGNGGDGFVVLDPAPADELELARVHQLEEVLDSALVLTLQPHFHVDRLGPNKSLARIVAELLDDARQNLGHVLEKVLIDCF